MLQRLRGDLLSVRDPLIRMQIRNLFGKSDLIYRPILLRLSAYESKPILFM